MASLIIPASKSLTVTNKLPNGNINEDVITVGHDGTYNYFSYLFFDTSSIPSNALITYSELVLFKTDNFYNDSSKVYGIYQLDDYFSTYTTYNNRPKIDTAIQRDFYPITSKAAATAILTFFVSLWNKNSFMNTGIMLYGKSKNIISKFGSSINQDKSLIPFLKVCYTSAIHQDVYNQYYYYYYNNNLPIEQVHVTGTVAANAKYEAIVNVEVLRSGSLHKDNYYVVDEYDNTSSSLPDHIDRTYSIPVVPAPAPGDTEDVKFYGSYKD